MPLGSFGNVPGANPSPQELSDAFSRLLKEVTYLLNGGLDTLNVNELSADVINAGVLNAALVTVKAALVGAAFIQLSGQGIKINDGTKDTFVADTAGKVTMTGATVKNNLTGTAYTQIDDAGIKINDGTKNTFVADINGLVTMVGALIQSATGYPRIELNNASNVFAAYSSATDAVKLVPIYSSGPPAWLFDIAGSTRGTISMVSGSLGITTSGATNINLQSAQDLILDPTGNLKIGTSIGFTGTFDVVSSVNFVAQTVTYTRVTVKKGIITNVAAV